MYNILCVVQIVGVLVLFTELVYILNQRPSKAQQYLLLFAVSSIVNAVGYLFELMAYNQSLAMLAIKFSYLGKVYIPLSMILFTLEYCRVHIPKFVAQSLFILHSLAAILVLTCDYHKLFYSSVMFVSSGLFPHVVLGHGIFYYAFMLLMLVYMIIMPTFCLMRLNHIRDKQEKRKLIFLMHVVILPFLGLIFFLTKVTGGYDSTAICYVISAFLLSVLLFRNNILQTVDIAKEDMIENFSDGVVVVDNNDELLYANAPAKKLLDIKRKLSDDEELMPLLNKLIADNEPYLVDGHYYETELRTLSDGERLHGKMYVITDVTDNYMYTYSLEKDVNSKAIQIRHMQRKVVIGLAEVIAARDDITGNHVRRTSEYVRLLSDELYNEGQFDELNDKEVIQDIIDAAPLHDIGKITIPDAILNKPGKLTKEEFEIIKTHSASGGKMLESILNGVETRRYSTIAENIATYHHERFDGNGYPVGLKGDEIPLCARIMAVCDVYDALVSERSYKKPMPPDEAYKIICDGAGTQFDPQVINAFRKKYNKIKKIKEKFDADNEKPLMMSKAD